MIDRFKKIVLIKKMVSNLPCPICKKPFERNNIFIRGEVDNLMIVDSICNNHQNNKLFNLMITITSNGDQPETLNYNDYLDFKNNVNKYDQSRLLSKSRNKK
ncbi:hypothetical protein COT76_01680 [Candidatus Berkelbacteria bacterium CG10_big_fil_rev_8_21_14_0_10_33_10]|uniref:Uncharacterized protein n=1 Tax=Candidatus Berkelbacteria bacterium CG_4_10_14_0_2_um_filter_35_9_33_12 TaxID=1974499 RepID=A0A2M7W4C3_9BACT|nr:MAG: hypothetical protein COX10_03000 [Candidatus Berkelbacteria bacterium CG23_combo_of_CG06-09_8_20_14_all_33_15]PIS08406.1 MAG: hypothetical protein COT76_01680 [Candidatus Berkelbacteria bacterium CG10_big_fil_rev_8_21_14_0_10_33_10]PJA20084.1 MAG: hypothetical protein COX60_02815 [Candidatus Berkelbacteria bacterium CG_4_10_14_0_2_um_filter_35_9_33_12]